MEKEYIIKEGFMLREIAGNYVVVAVGKASKEFNGMITLNETGAFFWNTLKDHRKKEEILEAVLNEYEIDKETALKDIELFLEKLGTNGILE